MYNVPEELKQLALEKYPYKIDSYMESVVDWNEKPRNAYIKKLMDKHVKRNQFTTELDNWYKKHGYTDACEAFYELDYMEFISILEEYYVKDKVENL